MAFEKLLHDEKVAREKLEADAKLARKAEKLLRITAENDAKLQREADREADRIQREHEKLLREISENDAKVLREAEKIKREERFALAQLQIQVDMDIALNKERLAREAAEAQHVLDLRQRDIQFQTEKESRDAREREKNRAFDVRLQRAQKIMTGVLTFMPTSPEDMPAYFNLTERFFDENKIDADLRITLVNKFLTDDARKMYASYPSGHFSNFGELKTAILTVYKLSPGFYRDMFRNAEKKQEETYTQFSYRLGIYLNYYLDSRKIEQSYERLRKLLISDKLKLTLSAGMRNQARLAEKGKWIEVTELAETLDNYVADIADMNYGKNDGGENKKFNKNFHKKMYENSANNHKQEARVDSPLEKLENKTFQKSVNKNLPDGPSGAAQSFEDRGPCFHCKQEHPRHSPLKCWKNSKGPHFRPDFSQKSNVKRVLSSKGQVHVSPVFEPSIKSVSNEFSDSTEHEKSLNASNFDIQNLFMEIPCSGPSVSDIDRKNVYKTGLKLLQNIPESCKIDIDVAGVTLSS